MNQNNIDHKMDLLVSTYIACIMLSELMGAKTFPLDMNGYVLNASVAIFTLPVIFTINDVITEVFGKERARNVVRSGLLMIVLLTGFSALATWMPASSRFAATNNAYNTIFGLSIRLSIASLTAFAISDFTDVFIFAKIRQKLGAKKLWLRNNVSNIISQLIDTTIFMTLAFYQLKLPFIANMQFLLSLIIPYWLLKSTMSIIETPFVYIGVKWLKKESQT